MVGDKGINELVDAFLMLLERELNVKLVLVGPYEKHLDPLKSKTIDKIERTDQIITVGYKKEVRPYYTIASCFVFPSYREGFPNVVLEALSMELPCIVTDINGSNEIIKNEFNGIIIPKKNMHALLEAMIVMKSNEVLRRFCTQNSRDSVLKKYDKELFYDVLLAEYKSLEKDL